MPDDSPEVLQNQDSQPTNPPKSIWNVFNKRRLDTPRDIAGEVRDEIIGASNPDTPESPKSLEELNKYYYERFNSMIPNDNPKRAAQLDYYGDENEISSWLIELWIERKEKEGKKAIYIHRSDKDSTSKIVRTSQGEFPSLFLDKNGDEVSIPSRICLFEDGTAKKEHDVFIRSPYNEELPKVDVDGHDLKFLPDDLQPGDYEQLQGYVTLHSQGLLVESQVE